ncbi:hypothetical protein EVAR_42032_1 [Eumeta japonica]|uniref:Uncharacterized protein n=1 Tax=Eumeta variegata TaxID=151549 RepID=A0A4C1YAM0_EUMVA|nr:hypothetical protein EVAR_42032_1 [Eumeta japonica]
MQANKYSRDLDRGRSHAIHVRIMMYEDGCLQRPYSIEEHLHRIVKCPPEVKIDTGTGIRVRIDSRSKIVNIKEVAINSVSACVRSRRGYGQFKAVGKASFLRNAVMRANLFASRNERARGMCPFRLQICEHRMPVADTSQLRLNGYRTVGVLTAPASAVP